MAPSVAQNLAPDLLYQIFLDATPSILSPNIFSTTPLNASLVCRSWRATTLEMSDLWASIRLSYPDMDRWLDTFPKYSTQPYKLLCRMLSIWMDRSGDNPLDIVLELHVDPEDCVLREARPAYDLLLGNLHRWRSMKINYMNTDFEHRLEESLVRDLRPSSLLESFSGSIYHTSCDTLITHVVGLDLSSCHNLKCLSLANSIKILPIGLDLHRLRVLKTEAVNMDGLSAVLQCSPNLETLQISEGIYGQLRNPQTSQIISLPVLTYMNVTELKVDLGWREWATLFQRLHCPSIVNFRFFSPDSDICLPLRTFFTRSRPPLERFDLDTMSHSSLEDPGFPPHRITAFIEIMKIIPSLVLLTVSGPLGVRPEFLQSLSMNRHDGTGLCPLLTRTMDLYTDSFYSFVRLSDGQEESFPQDKWSGGDEK
ncbi:hypothetical protein SCHPADRAFT_940628 [Schizopora paradoxa]|uniref:F-box domain-containing protein n=1 Tax=Schizopora paradoxa TaxID=27342 RepID=A0A0H2RNH0_9AGAM|nr:hypothetical protein SCHPADRAFT_940628 [Schizopora paradoxa]